MESSTAHLPVIALSASAATAAHRDVSLDAFDVVLTKPVRFNELLEQIGHCSDLSWVCGVCVGTAPPTAESGDNEEWDEGFIANLGDLAMRGDVQALKHLCDEASRHSMKMRQLLAELAPHGRISTLPRSAAWWKRPGQWACRTPPTEGPAMGCGLPAIHGGLRRESSLPEPLLRPSAAA